MKFRARRRNQKSSVDMTPMLDVVFQLIIFFFVSTISAGIIKVNLPKSSTAEIASSAGITITVTNPERFYFNEEEKPMNFEQLGKNLSEFDTKEIKKEEFPVTIKADENVKSGTIVKLFDIIRENGYSAVSLLTKEK